MLEKYAFGGTGHSSTRILFGAAALGRMDQKKSDKVLELLLNYGVNHIDTAAGYGDSELRVGEWMAEHRKHFFLATKTHKRDAAGARESLHQSLERLRVDSVDLIQLHNLVGEDAWAKALGPGGALEALIEARDEGLVRFIGVTGHGMAAPAMHRRSLGRFDFNSVLLPCNYSMLAQPEYRADFDALVGECRERGTAVQTIKSIARRRWTEESEPRYSWYEPLQEEGSIDRAVRFVLAQEGLFLNSSSDATLLPATLESARRAALGMDNESLESNLRADVEKYAVEPLFTPGGPQGI
ncbi:MAG: aldo/keto reductase [Myxococcota bacterium]|nr:aldo/keto reductase [Myxococcota bacterium]